MNSSSKRVLIACGKRILIVEDQRLIAADLEMTLTKLGYEVAGSVATGEDAIKQSLQTRPDLVLMDIRLRGEMDGIDAARLIREQMDVPVIYLTAYADEETILRAKVTTPFGYLTKPFNERELRAAIEVAAYRHETDRLLLRERARREAAEEFKLLVECVKDYAIVMLDAAGQVATWNDGATRIAGYRADEILGKHFSVFYPTEEVEAGRPSAALNEAREEGRSEDEGWRVRQDGSRFWASVVVTPIRDEEGRLRGFGKVTRDLSQQKRNEAALTESEELFRSVFNLATVGLGIVDASSRRFIRVNHKLEEITGYDSEELCRMTPNDLAYEEDREGDWTEFESAPEGEADCSHAEKRCARKDGRLLWVLWNTTSIRTPSDEPIRSIGVLEDITEIKNTEQKLRDAVTTRDEFLQVASHELKTPLTPLRLQLDTLRRALERDGLRGLDDKTLAAKLDIATRQAARLTRLIDSLLDVSRITGGQIALDRENLDLVEVVQDIVERFRPEARAVGSEIAVRSARHVEGAWDRLRIEQIFTNLLSNAVKYGAGKPIEVEVDDCGSVVRIAVRDHGIGIEPDALTRIFGRFERAVPLRNYGGLGLGLFIARQFAEAHGGGIEAESQLGAGSTFSVRLPAKEVTR